MPKVSDLDAAALPCPAPSKSLTGPLHQGVKSRYCMLPALPSAEQALPPWYRMLIHAVLAPLTPALSSSRVWGTRLDHSLKLEQFCALHDWWPIGTTSQGF